MTSLNVPLPLRGQARAEARENRWLPIVQVEALLERNSLGTILNDGLDAAEATHEPQRSSFLTSRPQQKSLNGESALW